jgi:hypothetical protein
MLTREQYIDAAWCAGELSWKLRPEQRRLKAELEKTNVQLGVFNISRRWGKTFTLVTYCLEQCLRTKQKIRYGCAFLTDLEEFVLPAFALLLEDCPARVKPVYKAARKTWVFPNGSEIKLVGIDKNPQGLRGNAIAKIIVDEAGFVMNLRSVYTSVIIPATMKQKDIKVVFISTPPESPEHYFVELIGKAQSQDNGYYLTLTIDDISDLDPAERKRILDEVGGEDSPTAQREFFCRIIVDATRAICASFKRERHVQPVSAEHVAWRLFGDSGGVRDKTVFLEVGFDLRTRLVMFKSELAFEHNTPTTDMIAAVKAKWPGVTTITLDAPGQLLIDYSSAGLTAALPAKDDFGAGLLLLLTTFHNDQAVVDPSCELLIKTLEGGLVNKQRTDYERTEALGHCDAAAAAIYAIRGADRVTDLRPKPKKENTFSIETDPPHIQQIKGLSHARR